MIVKERARNGACHLAGAVGRTAQRAGTKVAMTGLLVTQTLRAAPRATVASSAVAGLGSQGKRKAEKRSVQMSPTPEETELEDLWKRPPEEECDTHSYTLPLPRSSPDSERLKMRLIRDRFSWDLVEFAIVYQTNVGGQWFDVIEIDSCHDVDVHLHRYARSTGERVGDPEQMRPITTLAEVQDGYGLAIAHIEESWEAHRERWQYA